MTDELDRLKQALDATRPEPEPEARLRAVGAAQRAFEEEKAVIAQGSAAENRQNGGRANLLARLFGGRLMNISMPRLKPALMGGASVAVIAIAVLATRDLERKDGIIPPTAPVELRFEDDKNEMTGNRETLQAGLEKNATERGRVSQAAPSDLSAGAGETTALGDDSGSSRIKVRRAGSLERVVVEVPASGIAGAPASDPNASASPMPTDEMSRSITGGLAVSEQEAIASEPQIGFAMKQAEQFRTTGQLKVDGPVAADAVAPPIYQDQGRDNFEELEPNPVKVTAEEPVSTFSIDVDTASYSFMRGEIMRGVLPQKDAVRVEEMINYFPYDYDGPESRETPFKANMQIMPTPWNADTRLMRIGIKGYSLSEAERPRSNLVFLIDSSGSMNSSDKLPLLVNSFKLLLETLDADDTVAIVTYAGSAGTVLEPTKVAEAGKILASLERLHAGGSTAGAEGIRQAYRLAEQTYDPEGVNRVILATDGDFNVGITDMDELQGFIERKRKTGVLLSVLGFGHGNLNDALMQTLAQNGNGQAAYIDTLSEARKALVEEAGSTLFPIAKDVKIQIEFNPATVAEYRLIGYETRLLNREDFNNDKIDAGEIGSGHTVTALYELTPTGSDGRLVDDLRYQAAAPAESQSGEYAFLKIRYKAPGGDVSKLIETPVTRAAEVEANENRVTETRFAAAVAGFGQLLRGGRYMGDFSYDDVVELAQGAKGDDPFGYRAEFINLVRLAKSAAALEPLKP
jgi:Ca-activated chloride channel family protein